jgi:hypothetical protein
MDRLAKYPLYLLNVRILPLYFRFRTLFPPKYPRNFRFGWELAPTLPEDGALPLLMGLNA